MSANSSSDPFSLSGQVALITGGGTGLGEAIAAGLHRAGARVVIVGRREAELVRSAERIGPGATYLVHDLTQVAAAEGLIARISAEVGPIDCLVNNAGIHLKKPALDTSVDEFQQVLTTHVLGAHALTRAVAPGMIERRGGTILFIASMASLFGIPQVVAYSAAKSAYLGMVRTLATEWSPHRVRVNAIAPGWIETPMSSKALAGDPARRQKILGRTPMARLGQPEDVAWAAVYLAAPAGRFVTGVVLPIDGGASIGF
jgi:gluconate 5-dehydrogenase